MFPPLGEFLWRFFCSPAASFFQSFCLPFYSELISLMYACSISTVGVFARPVVIHFSSFHYRHWDWECTVTAETIENDRLRFIMLCRLPTAKWKTNFIAVVISGYLQPAIIFVPLISFCFLRHLMSAKVQFTNCPAVPLPTTSVDVEDTFEQSWKKYVCLKLLSSLCSFPSAVI